MLKIGIKFFAKIQVLLFVTFSHNLFALQAAETLFNKNSPLEALGKIDHSKIEQIKLIEREDGVTGNLSNKLVLQFMNLKNFSCQRKICDKNNMMIHCLVFSGLKENDSMLDELMRKLATITIPKETACAFDSFEIKPKTQKNTAGKSEPQVCILLRHDPQLAKVIIQQAAGQDMVQIEVFNRKKLKEVASGRHRGSILTLANNLNNIQQAHWLRL